MRLIQKYLKHYAEKETTLLESLPRNFSFGRAVVIPACNENSDFIQRLSSGSLSTSTLVVLVINQAAGAPTETFLTNRSLATCVSSHKCLWRNQNIALHQFNALHVLLVDRFSPELEIPEKEGVGRARKLGCDLAVALFTKGTLKTSWIYSTDADAYLPENYFSGEADGAAALVFDFRHVGETGPLLQATLLYEHALKYYQAALEWAGSPYAFYTLGSTLAVDVEAYCKVRGFPARSGAEDFYLLNKLAKIGDVRFGREVCIDLEARLSERVPFGTGPAVKKILDLHEHSEVYRYYHPAIFVELKTLLDNINALFEVIFAELSLDKILSKHCTAALLSLDFLRFAEHCKKQKVSTKQFPREFHTWFDAFQTLKFIHFLQNSVYHPLPLDECEALLTQYRQDHAQASKLR